MILNTAFIAEWEYIRLRNIYIYIYNNSQLENKNCKLHIFIILEKVYVRNKKANKYEEPHLGPYPITQVWTYGNVTIGRGAVQDRINIRWIKPYHG